MTLAAVDRLVHHSTIFEMNVESYRRRTAIVRKQTGAGRPASYATTRSTAATHRAGSASSSMHVRYWEIKLVHGSDVKINRFSYTWRV